MRNPSILLIPVLFLAGGVALRVYALRSPRVVPPAQAAARLEDAAAHPDQPAEAEPILDALRANLGIQRKLILLFAHETKLKGAAREAALTTGHQLHHENRALVYHLDNALAALAKEPAPRRDPVAQAILDWMEHGSELQELDKLAFRDPLRVFQKALQGSAQPANPQDQALQARLAKDLTEVNRLEALVDTEYRQVFGGPGQPARGGERKRWEAYLTALERLVPQPQPQPAPPSVAPAQPQAFKEIDGHELPDKVLVLSFDDGPHRVYTEEIKAILQQYHVPAVFFEVGRNLGAVDAGGAVKLKPLATLTADLVKSGFKVGNHSYTHAQLSKETGSALDVEIGETDKLLQAIPGAHSQLFRFPYGARTPVQLEALKAYHLRSVLWNIDSLDWADPVPSSVADRVLRTIQEEKRGIILFHDIHDRAGKVLPALLQRLQAEGYRFAGLNEAGEVDIPK